jgi:hypothetical protein
MKVNIRFLLTISLLAPLLLTFSPVLAVSNGDIYIPIVMNQYSPYSASRIVNIPYFTVSSDEVGKSHLSEMAIFWFGQVTPDDNYTDVRIAYTNTDLVIHTATFDRSLWYNPNSNGSDLESWDTVAITFQTDSGNYSTPSGNAYRFVVEEGNNKLNKDMSMYKKQYQGNNGGWVPKPSTFVADTFYRGELGFNVVPPNSDARNRGWGAQITIPFSALGLSAAPPADTLWRIHIETYDRDNSTGPRAPQVWPESSNINVPSTWANLHFGFPNLLPPPSKNPVIVELKNKVNVTAPDAQVGGGFLCGTTSNFFDVWGNLNYDHTATINIQNQADTGDWPCFSKYYITFPYTPPPVAGKIIRSAKLVMSIYGGSDPSQATASWIQALTISSDWDEATINWNNAPLAKENISKTLVNPTNIDLSNGKNWQIIPRIEWDVTRAVNEAYTSGQPVRLALYSADSDYHSGKYFVSSDTDISWNSRNLPALVIEYVDP